MKKICMLMLFIGALYANEIATVKLIEGEVKATLGTEVRVLKAGSSLDEKMLIQTAKDSSTTIVFHDNSVLVLGPNSMISLAKYIFKPKENIYDFKLYLKRGSAVFESGDIGKRSPESFKFETPQGTVAIRGTKFIVGVE